MKEPAQCRNMTELREGIDALDRQLVTLLARRAAFIDRAATIKATEGLPARIASRVEKVVANVRQCAEAAGLCPDLAETLWRELIEWSIAREETRLGPDSDRKG